METHSRLSKSVHILVADDDHDDCVLIKEAFEENLAAHTLGFVHNGEELMAYLTHKAPYDDSAKYPKPGLILLDLNMPLMDGRECLAEIKGSATLRSIPVIILTTSSADEDIACTYDAGCNSFITKPVTYSGLVEVAKDLGRYWIETVELPPTKKENP